MQIKSINPYYVTYKANQVSMKGTAADKNNIIKKVNKFLDDNKLTLTGTVMINASGVKYCTMLLGFEDTQYYIRTKDGLDSILISDCTSSDEILYKLAQKISGKTIFSPGEAENRAAMVLIGGDIDGYRHLITVPDFFNK